MSTFQFACPGCGAPLADEGPERRRCPVESTIYVCEDGIWRLLPPERLAHYERFMQEYQTVRRGEQRGSPDPEYYRALPFVDRSGRFSADWQIRAGSFRTLEARVLRPLAREARRALKVVDLGSGNGWLSNRLAQLGHDVAAVDLQTNAFDGLGAHVHYASCFTPVQADFDRLPFTENQMDLTIFNASLHYSTCYEETLGQALRILTASGLLVILDSPIYANADSGAQMVREREAAFQGKYGFASNALPSENYLTFQRLETLGHALGIDWTYIRPYYGLRWALRPWRARLTGRREPAQFGLIVGRRTSATTVGPT